MLIKVQPEPKISEVEPDGITLKLAPGSPGSAWKAFQGSSAMAD